MTEDKLIVALDVETFHEAAALVKKLLPATKIFKIGSQLFTNSGPEIVRYVNKCGARVFLDLKFHDIPNTVSKAAIECVKMGVFMFNVHALGGFDMMHKTALTVKAAAAKYRVKTPNVLAVTVLTSMNDESLKSIGITKSVKIEVIHLAYLAKRAGLDGIISSPEEARFIRREFRKNFLIATPGIRPAWSAKPGDQKRILSPKEAVENGADYIVVGRPILDAKSPVEAARRIIEEIG